jgi:hypothetical protein
MYEDRIKRYETFKNNAYYLIIGIVSFFAVAFLPFIGSVLGGELVLPTNPLEWAIFITTKLLVAGINVITFYSFIQQAKVNIKDNKDYKEGLKKLNIVNKHKNLKPRSPKTYFGRIWGTKGVILTISSLASAVVLAESVLNFEVSTFLSYLFTIFMAIIVGYLQMRSAEDYWISEFPAYADDELRKVELTRQEVKEC